MRLAIPIFRTRISPVFDYSTRLLIIQIENEREINRYEIGLAGLGPQNRIQRIKDESVNTLICAGLSMPLQSMLTVAGIYVIPGIVGDMDDVIRAFQAEGLHEKRFMMPGFCHKRRRRRFRGWQPGLFIPTGSEQIG